MTKVTDCVIRDTCYALLCVAMRCVITTVPRVELETGIERSIGGRHFGLFF